MDEGLRRSGNKVVGLLRSKLPRPGYSSGLRNVSPCGTKPGLSRPHGLNGAGLRRPVFKFNDVVTLCLRRCDERSVPCRDNENGLFDDDDPGLRLSCCDRLHALFCDSEFFRFSLLLLLLLFVFKCNGPWNGTNGPGLLFSDGDRRIVRKLCDLALRILAG